MNLKDLSKLEPKDLKNLINQGQLQSMIAGSPVILLNIILICATIGAIVFAFQSYTRTTAEMEQQIAALEEKSLALEKLNIAKGNFDEFKTVIPKTISENKLIQLLSEIALRSGVQIISFSPAQSTQNIFLNLTNVEVTIASVNYQDIIRFMHDIETSIYSIRVGRVAGIERDPSDGPGRRNRKGTQPDIQTDPEMNNVEATIRIEKVDFKYE